MSASVNKKFKITYLIAGVFILLAVYVYFGERIEKKQTEAKIFDVKKEDLKKFEILNNETKAAVVCEKISEDNWKMIKPKQYEMEKTELESVVNNLADLSIERKITENVLDLAPFGLAQPAYRVSFTAKGKTHALLIGSKNPTETYYYVKDEAKKDVYLIYSYKAESLKKEVKQLRKKTILDIETEKATKLMINFEKKELTFAKDVENKWKIIPYNFPADKETIEGLITKLKELKAIDFIEDEPADLKKYGLDKPRVTVSVFFGVDKPQMTLLIGKKLKDKEEDYVKREDVFTIYSIEHTFAMNFDKKYNDFRDKRLYSFKTDDIIEVEILKDNKKISAKKDRFNKFKVEEPVKKLSDNQFSNLISEVASLRADKFIDDSGKKLEKYGLKKPKYTISLFAMEGTEKKLKAKLFIGNEEKKQYYAKTDVFESVYTIEKNIINILEEIEKLLTAKK